MGKGEVGEGALWGGVHPIAALPLPHRTYTHLSPDRPVSGGEGEGAGGHAPAEDLLHLGRVLGCRHASAWVKGRGAHIS